MLFLSRINCKNQIFSFHSLFRIKGVYRSYSFRYVTPYWNFLFSDPIISLILSYIMRHGRKNRYKKMLFFVLTFLKKRFGINPIMVLKFSISRYAFPAKTNKKKIKNRVFYYTTYLNSYRHYRECVRRFYHIICNFQRSKKLSFWKSFLLITLNSCIFQKRYWFGDSKKNLFVSFFKLNFSFKKNIQLISYLNFYRILGSMKLKDLFQRKENFLSLLSNSVFCYYDCTNNFLQTLNMFFVQQLFSGILDIKKSFIKVERFFFFFFFKIFHSTFFFGRNFNNGRWKFYKEIFFLLLLKNKKFLLRFSSSFYFFLCSLFLLRNFFFIEE